MPDQQCWRSWIWMVLWRPTRPFRTNTQIDVFSFIEDLNEKVGSQETPGVTGKFGLGLQNEVGKRLTEFCQEHTGHSKHPLPTTQEKTLHIDITSWQTSKSDWLYYLQPHMEKHYTVSKNRTRGWLWLRSWTPIAKFRLKLKKVGKTTRPFGYDLNQIHYVYTVEVRNRFKGLDLIDRVPDELWMEICDIVQETGIKTILKKKKCKKAKWLSEEALQIGLKRREAKGKWEKERYTHLNAEFQREIRRELQGEIRKPSQWSVQRNRGKQQNGKD